MVLKDTGLKLRRDTLLSRLRRREITKAYYRRVVKKLEEEQNEINEREESRRRQAEYERKLKERRELRQRINNVEVLFNKRYDGSADIFVHNIWKSMSNNAIVRMITHSNKEVKFDTEIFYDKSYSNYIFI